LPKILFIGLKPAECGLENTTGGRLDNKRDLSSCKFFSGQAD
jgi:hypothetical protein